MLKVPNGLLQCERLTYHGDQIPFDGGKSMGTSRQFLKMAILAVFLMIRVANAGQVAQFFETNGTQDFSIAGDGTTNNTFNASSLITFTFSGTIPGGNPYPGTHQAVLTLTSSTTMTAALITGNISQGGYSGSFSIIDNATSNNLLSGTFSSDGVLSGLDGGDAATFVESRPPDTVNFSSFYLDFSNSTSQTISLSLSNLVANLSRNANNYLNPATGAGSGTFSADPLPTATVPEPATVALFGAGIIGLYMIRRHRKA